MYLFFKEMNYFIQQSDEGTVKTVTKLQIFLFQIITVSTSSTIVFNFINKIKEGSCGKTGVIMLKMHQYILDKNIVK